MSDAPGNQGTGVSPKFTRSAPECLTERERHRRLDAILPRQTLTYRCLIISPSDVHAERDAIEDALRNWNAHIGDQRGLRLEGIRWESHSTPELGSPAQAIINRQLVEKCDLGIAIFWSRLGSPTISHPSGSIEEIELLRSRICPVMIYFCERDIPQERLRDDQFPRLQQIKRHYMTQGLLAAFHSIEELRGQVPLHVNSLIGQLAQREVTRPSLPGAMGETDTALTPDVRLRPVCVAVRGRQEPIIELRIENHSPNVVFLESLEFTTDSLESLQIDDCVKNEPFGAGRLEAGDSRSFYFDILAWRARGERIIDAVVRDKIHRAFRTSGHAFEAALLEWQVRRESRGRR